MSETDFEKTVWIGRMARLPLARGLRGRSGHRRLRPRELLPGPRTVSGQEGLITDLNVAIDGIWHQNPDDLTCSWSDHRARR